MFLELGSESRRKAVRLLPLPPESAAFSHSGSQNTKFTLPQAELSGGKKKNPDYNKMKISRFVKRNLLLKIKQLKFFPGNTVTTGASMTKCAISFTPEMRSSSIFGILLQLNDMVCDPLPLSLRTELGYTVTEASGAAGECPPGVRASGTRVGKKTRRVWAGALEGPRILAGWDHCDLHQKPVSERLRSL